MLGGAAGAGAITGFPTIWAQEIKDIELRHVGVSYSVVKAIGDQASKDLGFKVTMQNLDTSAAINRFITQPNSVDIADVEGWQSKLATKRGVLQGIEVKKIKEFDNILPIFTKGELEGHKIPRQGISPYEAMYIGKPTDTELHEGVTDYMTFLPAQGRRRWSMTLNVTSPSLYDQLVGCEVDFFLVILPLLPYLIRSALSKHNAASMMPIAGTSRIAAAGLQRQLDRLPARPGRPRSHRVEGTA